MKLLLLRYFTEICFGICRIINPPTFCTRSRSNSCYANAKIVNATISVFIHALSDLKWRLQCCIYPKSKSRGDWERNSVPEISVRSWNNLSSLRLNWSSLFWLLIPIMVKKILSRYQPWTLVKPSQLLIRFGWTVN